MLPRYSNTSITEQIPKLLNVFQLYMVLFHDLNTNIRTITGISNPELATDTMKGRVGFFVHTTFMSTVTSVIETTALTSH